MYEICACQPGVRGGSRPQEVREEPGRSCQRPGEGGLTFLEETQQREEWLCFL